ncbi:MAG: hypothetical protein LAT64_04775 [Phycisphaerales bacterium]|nr:hypothetical protein [Planctomycetota bacterium]MCH8508068.1 hypothetical protein [Phycisphaerales bacterium]
MPDQPVRKPTRPSEHAPAPARRRTVASASLDRTSPLDLRKHRDAEAAGLLVLRADWLSPADRALVVAVLRDGQSVAAMARATGMDPRSLRRRFAQAASRLLDDRTVFVARLLPSLTGTRARVARAFYLEGRSLRAIANEQRLGLHTVRAHRQAIEGMYEASRRHSDPGIDRVWKSVPPGQHTRGALS